MTFWRTNCEVCEGGRRISLTDLTSVSGLSASVAALLFVSLRTPDEQQMELEKQRMSEVHKRGELVFLRNKVNSCKQEISNMRKVMEKREEEVKGLQRKLTEKEKAFVSAGMRLIVSFFGTKNFHVS